MSSQEQKDELSSKLTSYFTSKLDSLQSKFEADITALEGLKYQFFDSCIKEYELLSSEPEPIEDGPLETAPPLRPTNQSLTSFPSKKVVKKTNGVSTRSKTPLKADNKHNEKSLDKSKPSKKSNTTLTRTADKSVKSKSHFNVTHKENNGEKAHPKENTPLPNKDKSETPSNPKKIGVNKRKPVTNKPSANNTKDKKEKTKTGMNNHDSHSNLPNNNNVKVENNTEENDKSETATPLTSVEKKSEEHPKEEVVNDFKEITLKNNINSVTIAPTIKDKTIIPIPELIKENKALSSLYMMLKGKYISLNSKFSLIKMYPSLYKSFDSKLNFLLEAKVDVLSKQVAEIESTLSKYDDVDSYINKSFTPSKTAQNSLTFVTKEEEMNLIKKEDLPNEIGFIFKLVYYIIDEKFDKDLPTNKIIENLINVVFPKYEAKDLRNLLTTYVNQNQNLNITEEKFNEVNELIKANPKILSSIDMARINRPISYMTFFIKEVVEYMSLKTSDGVYYYDLRNKSKIMKDNKNIIERYKQLLSEHSK